MWQQLAAHPSRHRTDRIQVSKSTKAATSHTCLKFSNDQRRTISSKRVGSQEGWLGRDCLSLAESTPFFTKTVEIGNRELYHNHGCRCQQDL